MPRPAPDVPRRSITVRVPEDALETIDAAAEAAGESRTEYLIGAALNRSAGDLRAGLTRRQRRAIAREVSRFLLEDLEL